MECHQPTLPFLPGKKHVPWRSGAIDGVFCAHKACQDAKNTGGTLSHPCFARYRWCAVVLTIMSVPDEAEMQLDAVERPKMYQEVKEADKKPAVGRMVVAPGGRVATGP